MRWRAVQNEPSRSAVRPHRGIDPTWRLPAVDDLSVATFPPPRLLIHSTDGAGGRGIQPIVCQKLRIR